MNYTIEIKVNIIWLVKGYENYGFGNDKILYNLRRGTKLKQSYNNRCIGYWFGKTFISLNKLKPLLYKPEKSLIPF